MTLHAILAEQLSAALAPAPPLARTRRHAELPAVPGKVHAVIGMRRAGKTTFLRQLLDERRALVPTERALYLSFDDDRLGGLEVEQLGFLLEEYHRRHPALRGRETVSWLFDEIHLVPGWERFVRRVLDSEQVEIAVSGSSARILSREMRALMAAAQERPRAVRRLLVFDRDALARVGAPGVEVRPVYEWLRAAAGEDWPGIGDRGDAGGVSHGGSGI